MVYCLNMDALEWWGESFTFGMDLHFLSLFFFFPSNKSKMCSAFLYTLSKLLKTLFKNRVIKVSSTSVSGLSGIN